MRKFLFLLSFAIIVIVTATILRAQRQSNTPPHTALTSSELLALVAGDALPENIVHEIAASGLNFRPNDSYKTLLTTAGADPKILTALATAKIGNEQSPEVEKPQQLLQHLATAGQLLKQKSYDPATTEMSQALKVAKSNCPECAFVVSFILRSQENWGDAATMLTQVLEQRPNFPSAHSKFSFLYYKLDDPETGLTESKTALKQNPDDPEAHKNGGLSLMSMQKFDAAEAEFNKALRLKPDYGAAHENMGVLFMRKHDYAAAIPEFRKAETLLGPDVSIQYNLANSLQANNQIDAAIQAFREAKRLDPKRYDIRQDFGAALMNHGHPAEAVVEFRELVALYPDTEMCTYSLGLGLVTIGQFDQAEPVLRQAAQLDPSDPMPYFQLGYIREQQSKPEQALEEYNLALKRASDYPPLQSAIARIELQLKNTPAALEHAKLATEMAPADANAHDYYGRALMESGKIDDAVMEFKQAVTLNPQGTQIMLRYAAALEKKGDWIASLDTYRRAAQQDASVNPVGKVTLRTDRDPQRDFRDAQKRFDEHLAALKSAGKSAEAEKLQAQLKAAKGSDSLSDQLNAEMRAYTSLVQQQRREEAFQHVQKAVELAEKIQPHDPRLITCLEALGEYNLGRNPAAAQKAFERELQVAQEIFGPESPNMTTALQMLGQNAAIQHDYATAEKFFFRAVDLNRKFFGEGSEKTAETLVQATSVYFMQKDYAKAEPYLLRAVKIDEALFGPDGVDMLIPRGTLCGLYDRWEQADKAASCNRVLLTILEKQYGDQSPLLVDVLAREAKDLRTLGHAAEADKFDQRATTIRASTMNPN